MKRLVKIDSTRMESNGRGALATFVWEDGSSDQVEIAREFLAPLMQWVLDMSVEVGARAAQPLQLPDVRPDHAVQLQATDLALRDQADGGLTVMYRLGAVDLAALLTPDARAAFAQALGAP